MNGRAVVCFLKKEAVLCLSFLAALISVFLVLPDEKYGTYIDARVLILLFCLMAVVSGFREAGILSRVSSFFLRRAASSRRLGISLVLLCFFCSMLLTNDVALLTFVPLCIAVMQSVCPKGTAITVVLMTVAANLGSMATPVGNPQNLYLYGYYQLNPAEFFSVVLPTVGISFLLLLAAGQLIPSEKIRPVLTGEESEKPVEKKRAMLFGALFLLALLAVLRVVPEWPLLGITVGVLLLFSRRTFLRVDWGLLLTFVFFFVFVGNLGRMEPVYQAAAAWTKGSELWCGLLLSQGISNVPAAMMLAPFAENGRALLLGVNIGGLGTLVASLASLISFKLYTAHLPGKGGRYLLLFTAINLLFLLPVVGLAVWMGWA
ncbi:MAG: SLC13 family permease [Candidatus Heritagella sp.]|nr:SLC13 family permease [Candidatus Heritagella sp.]